MNSTTGFLIHPAVNQLLQASLAAQMFGLDVMGCHVFPGINLEHPARRGLIMRFISFRPRQPPMIKTSFLLSADIAIECFRPGHATTSFGEFYARSFFSCIYLLLSTKY